MKHPKSTIFIGPFTIVVTICGGMLATLLQNHMIADGLPGHWFVYGLIWFATMLVNCFALPLDGGIYYFAVKKPLYNRYIKKCNEVEALDNFVINCKNKVRK